MFEDFSTAGRAVMDATTPIAVSLGHNYIGTEHLLLALLAHEERVGDGPLTARGVTTTAVTQETLRRLTRSRTDAAALRAVGVDPEAIVRETKAALGADITIRGIVPSTQITLTPRVFTILNLAIGRAATEPVEPRHLLQALLEEDGGLAVVVLDHLGVDLDALGADLTTSGR